jgi:hypothetical protein
LTEFYDVKTQFFDKINLSYYPLDNWKVSSSATATSAASTLPRSAPSGRCRSAAAHWPRFMSKVVPGKTTSAGCGAA